MPASKVSEVFSYVNVRSSESGLTRIVAVGGKTSAGGLLEHELVAILVLEGVGEGVEVQSAGKRHGDNEIGGGDEGVGGGVGWKFISIWNIV